MIKRFIAWVKGEVLTVEHIIADFTSTVTRLENHAASKLEELYNHEETSRLALVAAANAQIEAAKATTVATRIKGLLA